jgi:hypothetical protein
LAGDGDSEFFGCFGLSLGFFDFGWRWRGWLLWLLRLVSGLLRFWIRLGSGLLLFSLWFQIWLLQLVYGLLNGFW